MGCDPTAGTQASHTHVHPISQGKGAALEVTVHAGQALYVPAGWFHEVTSMGDAGSAQDNPAGVHMALNYWFYPPDALRDVDGQHPYK